MEQSPPEHGLRTIIVQDPEFYTVANMLDPNAFDKLAYHHDIVDSNDLGKNKAVKAQAKQVKALKKTRLNPKPEQALFTQEQRQKFGELTEEELRIGALAASKKGKVDIVSATIDDDKLRQIQQVMAFNDLNEMDDIKMHWDNAHARLIERNHQMAQRSRSNYQPSISNQAIFDQMMHDHVDRMFPTTPKLVGTVKAVHRGLERMENAEVLSSKEVQQAKDGMGSLRYPPDHPTTLYRFKSDKDNLPTREKIEPQDPKKVKKNLQIGASREEARLHDERMKTHEQERRHAFQGDDLHIPDQMPNVPQTPRVQPTNKQRSKFAIGKQREKSEDNSLDM